MASSSTTLYTKWKCLEDDQISAEHVSNILGAIEDDLWVVAACLDRVLDNTGVQNALIQLGIERSKSFVDRYNQELDFQSTSTNPNQAQSKQDTLLQHFNDAPVDAQLCAFRSTLLERLDRLNTYIELEKEVPPNQGADMDEEIEEWEDDPWADGVQTAAITPMSDETKLSTRLPFPLSSFLLNDLVWSACELATGHWINALCTVFQRHAASLWAYRFTILDSLPEHCDPSTCRDIFPALDPITNVETMPPLNEWRPIRDLSEKEDVQSTLAKCPGILRRDSHVMGVSLHATAYTAPSTPEELSLWYKNRVNKILSSTGMVDVALSTVQHGASQGIPSLDELGEELSLLSRLVYDAPQDDKTSDDWTLNRWVSMEPPAVLRAYLFNSTPESLSRDISLLVMPYLYVLESRAERAGAPDPDLPNRLLYNYILTAPIEMSAAIFEASKPTLYAAERLIRNDEDIVRLALACLYGSNELDQWSTMSRVFECLPAWDIARDNDNNEDAADTTLLSLGSFVSPTTNRPHVTPSDLLIFFKPLSLASLSRALDILDIHLESAEILSRWRVPAPLRWFLQSSDNADEQRAWANRMARRAGGTEDQLVTQEDWEWLLEDMLKLTERNDTGLSGAFGLLTRNEIVRIFLSGLLSTGKFELARSLLRTHHEKIKLDTVVVEDICVDCSREFYDNASSGNYKFGDMKLAYECLDVPPPSERLIKEKEFIEATSRISSFNVTSRPGILISPIEIRLTKDPLSLISRVLSSNTDAYKHTEVILDLCHKLGFQNDAVAEVKVLAMLADTALQAEDFNKAYENSERMVAAVFKLRASAPLGLVDTAVLEATEVCWIACFQLGRQPEYDDLSKKLSLLGRALELCPPDKLYDVVTAWRRLEKNDISAREDRVIHKRIGTAASSPQKSINSLPRNMASSLRARLQDFHMPAPPMLNTPDAAALASRTFRSVANNFPFSAGHRGRSQMSNADETDSQRSGSLRRIDGEDVSSQATRVLSKGIGWLIGTDEE